MDPANPKLIREFVQFFLVNKFEQSMAINQQKFLLKYSNIALNDIFSGTLRVSYCT